MMFVIRIGTRISRQSKFILTSIFLLVIFLASFCSPGSKKTFEASLSESELRLAEVNSLIDRGNYLSLRRAWEISQQLYQNKTTRSKAASLYLKASLLLALRQKMLGFENDAVLSEAKKIITENTQLASLGGYLYIVYFRPPRTRGVIRDIITPPEVLEEFRKIQRIDEEELIRRSASDLLSAIIYSALVCSYGYYSDQRRNPEYLLRFHPESLSLKYQIAICDEEREDMLEDILKADPDFGDVYFHLGEAALKKGRLLEAESHLLKAMNAVPDSPQVPLLLAGIYFVFEEFDQSLEYYSRALQILPDYRDALLGQASCLSYMGRHDEALPVLERILELGYWLIGESYYWLAWNMFYGLKKVPEALININEAKKRLPTDSEVLNLSGKIALEIGDEAQAEKDFQESLQLRPNNVEALLGLGNLRAKQALWREAGDYFGKAGVLLEESSSAAELKIKEIRQSSMDDKRKEGQIRRRQIQLEKIKLDTANCFYNAAVSLANADLKAEAIKMAEKAAAHPSVKGKAREFIQALGIR